MKPFRLALFAYVLSFVLFYLLKLPMMFDSQGNVKHFGTGSQDTILPIWFASTLIGILTYSGSALLEDILRPIYQRFRNPWRYVTSPLVPVEL